MSPRSGRPQFCDDLRTGPCLPPQTGASEDRVPASGPDTMQFCRLASREQARLINGSSAASLAILSLRGRGRRGCSHIDDGSLFFLRSPGCYISFPKEMTLSAALPQGSPVCALGRGTAGTLVLGLTSPRPPEPARKPESSQASLLLTWAPTLSPGPQTPVLVTCSMVIGNDAHPPVSSRKGVDCFFITVGTPGE